MELRRLLDRIMAKAKELSVSTDGVIPVSPGAYRELIRLSEPNRHMLYSAGWRSGFTVNGIPAE